jgi:7-carboxy-7-deazaguanine synthase
MPTDWDKLGKCVESGGVGAETTLKVVIFDEKDYAYAREVAEHFPEIPMYLQWATTCWRVIPT